MPLSEASNFKANRSIYIRLDPEKSLLESLKAVRIMEFPSIHVVDEPPMDWTIEEP
jgi:hypothetical protein